MKHFKLAACAALIAAISAFTTTHAQTIAEYPLTVDGSPTSLDANVSATDLVAGSNVGSIGYSSNGATANGWPQVQNLDEDSYFEITISPQLGYEMTVTDINFGYRRSGTGPLAYELYWSTDGVLANSTRLDSVAMPASIAAQVGSLSGLSINIAEGETLHLKWYAYDASSTPGTFRMDVNNTNLIVEGSVSLASTDTGVFFNGESDVTGEDAGTFDLNVSIVNEHTTATSVDVVLVSGDAARVNGFTSQTVNFPASTTADQTVSLTLTNDGNCEDDSELVFALQNPSGGNNAEVIFPTQFTLNITDDDKTINTAYSNDFEDNNLDEWTQNAEGDWATSATSPITGTYSLKHNLSGVAGESSIATSLKSMALDGFETTWSFEMKNGAWAPSSNNRFWVYLASSAEGLLPTANTSGYAVGVNLLGSGDLLTLYRIDAGGTEVELLASSLNWGSGTLAGIRVTRNALGEWELLTDSDGGFDNLVSAGTVSDNTYSTANYFGAVFDFTSSRAGEFWVDNIDITQASCVRTYYSQTSGNFSDPIWDEVVSGSPGAAAINRYNSFVIQAGHSVTLDGDAQVADLTIDNTGTFALANSQYTLGVSGSWTNNGTLDAGDSRVCFFGTGGTYAISGTNEFFDLEVALLGDNLTLNSNTDVWGTLYLSNGVIDVNSNVFTLRSDATTTAAVAPVEAGSVSGNVTVERYIQSGVNSWRNLGTSVSGATLQDWNDHFTTTGIPGSDYPNWPSPANRFPNIKSYDETDLGNREIGWRAATSITNSIGDGQGFWMYIGGSELPNTVDASGTLITGDQTLNLDYTPDLGAFDDGWNLVSNLYAATVDWDSPDFGKSGLEDGIWIWNQDVQQYGSYISGVSTHSVTNEIAHSQSFWVHANAASPSLTFRESIKTTNNNADWIKVLPEEQGLVRFEIAGNGYYDETVVVFNPEASTGYEGSHDAMKFYSVNEAVPSLATVTGTGDSAYDLAINSVDLPEGASFSIPMKALAGSVGTHTLSVTELDNIGTDVCIYVEDMETGEIMLLAEGAEMAVELDTAYSDARFMLHISGGFTTEKQDHTCNGANDGWLSAQGTGEGPWTYTWKNSMDEIVQVTSDAPTADVLEGVEAGAYTVQIAGAADVCGNRHKQLFLYEPVPLTLTSDATAPSCNSGANGQIAVELAGGNGTWDVTLMQNDASLSTNSGIATMTAFDGLSAGNYTVSATNSCGTLTEAVVLSDENSAVADFYLPFEEISLVDGGVISLTNQSVNATVYAWDMGDGTTLFGQDVTHTYTSPGTYDITLYSTGDYCEDQVTKSLTVTDIALGIADNDAREIAVWYTGGEIIVEHTLKGQEANINIVNILGKVVYSGQSFDNRIVLPFSANEHAQGVYLVNIEIDQKVETHKVVIH